MSLLTQAEVDSVVGELGPLVDTPEHLCAFGMGVYKELFGAKPDYIPLFTKLSGLNKDNVMQSEGIKYYGRTLAEDLVGFLKAAANKSELDALLSKSGNDHTKRNVTKAQFMSGEPIFVEHFNRLLTKPENKKAMEKLIRYVVPAIASKL